VKGLDHKTIDLLTIIWACESTSLLYLQVVSRFNETFARKLSVENVLQGHEGCVNRLTWNEEGNLLASASDDRRVRQDPDTPY